MPESGWQRYHVLNQLGSHVTVFRRGTLITYLAFGALCLFAIYEFLPQTSSPEPSFPIASIAGSSALSFQDRWNASRDRMNLRLDNDQCSQAFPGLFVDIDRAIKDREESRITIKELEQVPKINGYVRGMIYHQELFIIDKQGGIYSRELATLSALNRAIVTSPDALPNVEFTFISDDRVGNRATWVYARRAEDKRLWLIPDFGFWAWPETKAGSYNVAQQKTTILEDGDALSGHGPLPFVDKIDKLVWRGATMGLPLREKFIDTCQNRTWADVRAIKWHNEDSMRDDLLSMEDHCRYKFVAHTEGNSYSGRLKYLQNCRSVVVAHTMDWIQHYQHLMRSSGPQQNYVEVRRDFQDLDATMNWLILNVEEAQKIADNSVATFRDHYLTPAAQACYWRRLVHGWASMSFEPQRWAEDGQLRGVAFEDFILERKLHWDPY